ncbi:hypothetical protein AXK56_00610 [Tsukamurella pulmonis]|uniref:Uncharacterized protein n=1 Tax=Tsukamurella pseudospumae TaxID=239498 RepID=A0A138AUL3_9ACTN|nr:hypothetical protein AXK56_00610 [Tsukamurella pulmonis]KXP14141.1 hypothetical protein AXK60_21915 [Tsukamurella pseudospumae]SUP26271.1 Uncharacterised protein [Tsukamurella pulmonis]
MVELGQSCRGQLCSSADVRLAAGIDWEGVDEQVEANCLASGAEVAGGGADGKVAFSDKLSEAITVDQSWSRAWEVEASEELNWRLPDNWFLIDPRGVQEHPCVVDQLVPKVGCELARKRGDLSEQVCGPVNRGDACEFLAKKCPRNSRPGGAAR